MNDIFEIKFPIETYIKENVIQKFSNKQGGDFNIFSYYWQCFVWAATIGFLRNERKELSSPTERVFSLNTMRNNNGEKDAQALICMCIARNGSLEIMKTPEEAIKNICEYANAGFYHIMELMETGEYTFNDFEQVKQEIFSRNYDSEGNFENVKILPKNEEAKENEEDNTDVESIVKNEELGNNTENEETPEPIIKKREWSDYEEIELYNYYRQGLTVSQLAHFLKRTEDEVKEKLESQDLL